MKYKSLFWLPLLVGAVLFAAGSGQTGGLGLVVQQIETIGPRQWFSLMAGSIVPLPSVLKLSDESSWCELSRL